MRVLLFFILLPLSVISQDKHAVLIDSLMLAQAAVYKFNGNVLVAKSGKIIYQKAHGYKNYDTKEMLDNNSLFELASISKQFTAMGILLLKEKGKLNLTDSLRKFFPELPYYNITIHQLLSHTSGLPDYEGSMNDRWDRRKIAFNKDVIHFLATQKLPPFFAPGKQWMYSNTGYALLASIIEKVSGRSFSEFMHTNIFLPLRMTRTRIYNTRRSSKEIISNYAYGYVYSDSLKRYMLPDSLPAFDFVRYLDGIQGDGVVNSTTGDLLLWDRALKNNVLLKKAAQKLQFSAHAIVDTIAKVSYGYGIMIAQDKFGTNLAHSGGWPGYATFMTRVLKDDLTIIVLSNNESKAGAISNQISYLLHDEPVVFPYLHQEVKIDTSALAKYEGKYRSLNTIELFKENGKLYRKGRINIELKPESATKFFYADGSDRQIEFADGKVWLISNGIKTELKKE